jgi:hypothetical protein
VSGILLVVLSLTFVLSYNLIPAGPEGRRYVEATRFIGKIAFMGDLSASCLAIIGWFVDRRKVLAVLVIVSGICAAGVIGMFVCNI